MNEPSSEHTAGHSGQTLSEAWGNLLRHPSLFITQWNYKGAVMSGLIRAPFFFATLSTGDKGSLKLGIANATVQFIFRFLFGGIGGALIQAMRRVEPPWKALLSILVVVPVISHVFEIGIQLAFASATDTGDKFLPAILRSVCVSVFSALFTLYIMRKDVLIVGEGGSKSLLGDFKTFPRLIFDFLAFVPNQMADMVRRGAYLALLLSFAGWAVFSQIIVMAFYRPELRFESLYWTLKKGEINIPVIRYYMVCACILMGMAVTASLIKERLSRSSASA